jgi:hypothetical protein
MPTLTTAGQVTIPAGVNTSALLAHLVDCLRDVNAKEVRAEGNSVSFVGGIFRFVTNWNVLVSFGFGDLTVDSAKCEVSFRLNYRQLVICTGIMFLVVVAGLLFVGLPPASWLILAAPFIYLVAVTSNIAVGVLHFRYFLRRSIATAPPLNR